MMEEVWKDIIEYPGYQISNLGRIKSFRKIDKINGLIRKACSTGEYLCISINYKNIKIHRLVCKYFVENPFNYNTVNHKDGDKTNNVFTNLEWCTNSYNVKHAYDALGRTSPSTGKRGKLWKLSKKVIQMNSNEEIIKIWDAIMEASRELGVDRSDIIKVCTGKRKTCGGFKWKYLN